MGFVVLDADGLTYSASDDAGGFAERGAAGSLQPSRPMCNFCVLGADGSVALRAWCGACAGSDDALPNTGEVLPASDFDEHVDDVMPFSFLSFFELD